MTYIPEYWKDKQWRARQAQKHTELMAEKYSKEIQHSVDNTVIYDGATFTPKADCKVQNESGLAIDNLDSVSAIFKHNYDENEKIAVLNFASYKNPGGMFINGSKAQEECLCHDSFLYNVLKEFTDSYYARNNLYKNKALYMDRALYSPDVVFEVDGKLRKVDVITCAAPNKSAAQNYLNVTDEENYNVLKQRIKFVLDIAKDNQVDTLILGAYGCGVFGQNPIEVAEIFKYWLYESEYYTYFKTIVFAIPGGVNAVNLHKFSTVFSENS